MPLIPNTVCFAIQVRPRGISRLKYQNRIRFSTEVSEAEREMYIHRSAARTAAQHRDIREWPSECEVEVWYAEIDEDLDCVKQEFDWHPLKG